MPNVNFVLKDGTTKQAECAESDTVMQAATNNAIAGVEAICGGFCNCATCHVYVDEAWAGKLPPPSDDENDMLDGTAADREPTSRLSCQIKVTAALDGITVRIPDKQA